MKLSKNGHPKFPVKTLADCANDTRVKEVSDERNNQDGIWVYMKNGYCNSLDETHCLHEDSVKEIVKAFRWIEPCAKDCCTVEVA